MYSLMIYSMFMMLMGSLMLIMGMYMYMNSMMLILEWLIFMVSGMKFNYMIYLDYMSLLYMSTIMFISSMIMMYSMDYMMGDIYINRFKYLLMLFIFSMCLMILSPGILSVLLGWDGLGLISYCLVIYYQNKNSYNSGMLTILCNRLGDVGVLMLISMSSFLGSWNLMLYEMSLIMMMYLLLAMFTKSAQMPFSGWLPAAMTAPTPISSLVHSSTLVTAGVYLLIRYNKFIDIEVKNYIIMISSCTMFMAGLVANYENNLKKIIALSTLSQLGFMMSILGMGMIELGFCHLLIHAFFKSLMFMCVGEFIHLSLGGQDLRKFKGIYFLTPFQGMVFFFSLFNLTGFPFFSGFYSKELILDYFNMNMSNKFMIYILLVSTILTVSYTVRLIKLFFNILLGIQNYQYIGDSWNYMYMCKFLMFIIVMVVGYFYMNLFNFYNFMVTEVDKLTLYMLYFSCWSVTVSFHYSRKMLMSFYYLSFVKNMFYSIYMYKIIYLNYLFFMLMYEKYNEKWLDKMLGVNLKKMFFLQKMYPLMNSWIFSINMMKLLKFYVILLIYYLLIN